MSIAVFHVSYTESYLLSFIRNRENFNAELHRRIMVCKFKSALKSEIYHSFKQTDDILNCILDFFFFTKPNKKPNEHYRYQK